MDSRGMPRTYIPDSLILWKIKYNYCEISKSNKVFRRLSNTFNIAPMLSSMENNSLHQTCDPNKPIPEPNQASTILPTENITFTFNLAANAVNGCTKRHFVHSDILVK